MALNFEFAAFLNQKTHEFDRFYGNVNGPYGEIPAKE